MFTINPSSFEFIQDGTTNAQYPEGCLRYQAVKHIVKEKRERVELHPIYSAIGTIAEEYIANELEGEEFVTREAELLIDLGDDVYAKGRVDYLLPDRVIEVKASVSSSKRAMWRRGEMVPTHVGQCLSYMYFTEREHGCIRAFYMHFTREGLTLSLEPFVYTITMTPEYEQAVVAYYSTVKQAMIGDELPPPPVTAKPCASCIFRNVCQSGVKSKADFVDEVTTVLSGPLPMGVQLVPKIKTHNRRG